MSYAQSARDINCLCDLAAERYQRSAVGQFPADQVRADLARLALRGFEVRRKTPDEVLADCAAVDAKLGKIEKPAKKVDRRKTRRPWHTDAQRLAFVAQVHAQLATGLTAPEACRKAGVVYQSFIAWRKRFGITEPVLPGRLDIKKGGGYV